jgi:hypothetical protein
MAALKRPPICGHVGVNARNFYINRPGKGIKMNDSIRLNGWCSHGVPGGIGCESCRKEHNEVIARLNNKDIPVAFTNNRSDEIAWLDRFHKDLMEYRNSRRDFWDLSEQIMNRIAQLRAMR